MTTWITGASGFIGSTLAGVLRNAGTSHVGLDTRGPERETLPSDSFVTGQVSEECLSNMLALGGPPARVYHLAGGSSIGPSLADPAADFAATVGSTAILLDFLRRNARDATVILASSAAVYGGHHSGRIPEGAALDPLSPYGVHKRMMEMLGHSFVGFFDMDVRVARLFSVYGSGLRKQIFWDLCCKLARGDSVVLSGSGDEARDFVHGLDAARALTVLAGVPLEPRCRLVNVGSGTATTTKAAAGFISAEWVRATGRKVTISFDGKSRPGDPPSLVAETGTMSTLGIKPSIDLEDGLDAYVRWFLADSRKRG
jgi:UDP-glucose 4-epimerase